MLSGKWADAFRLVCECACLSHMPAHTYCVMCHTVTPVSDEPQTWQWDDQVPLPDTVVVCFCQHTLLESHTRKSPNDTFLRMLPCLWYMAIYMNIQVHMCLCIINHVDLVPQSLIAYKERCVFTKLTNYYYSCWNHICRNASSFTSALLVPNLPNAPSFATWFSYKGQPRGWVAV